MVASEGPFSMARSAAVGTWLKWPYATTAGISSGIGIRCLRPSAASIAGARRSPFSASRSSSPSTNSGMTSAANSSSERQLSSWDSRPAWCSSSTWSTPAACKARKWTRISSGVPMALVGLSPMSGSRSRMAWNSAQESPLPGRTAPFR